jgi:hypothetical protein
MNSVHPNPEAVLSMTSVDLAQNHQPVQMDGSNNMDTAEDNQLPLRAGYSRLVTEPDFIIPSVLGLADHFPLARMVEPDLTDALRMSGGVSKTTLGFKNY